MFAMGPGFFAYGGAIYDTLGLTGTFPGATVGIPYDEFITISGGELPYSLTGGTGVSSGTLPDGMSLSIENDDELHLSGTPTTAETAGFTNSVDSSDGQTATSAQSVVVTAAGKWYNTLFASGEQGMVVDFDDLSSLFQDTSHTVPVTAVGQPIKSVRCQRTGAYGVVNSGTATLAYDSTYSKYYAAGDGSFNLAFAGAVPSSLGANANVSMVAVCSYVSTAQTIGVYIGPAYPTNPANGNAIGLMQINDSGIKLEYLQFGSGRGVGAPARSGVKVITGVKSFGAGLQAGIYDGTTLLNTNTIAGGNITALNLDIGRGAGTAQSYYCLLAIDRPLTVPEITAYNVGGQAL